VKQKSFGVFCTWFVNHAGPVGRICVRRWTKPDLKGPDTVLVVTAELRSIEEAETNVALLKKDLDAALLTLRQKFVQAGNGSSSLLPD
jgi:hypothetical protein